MRRNSIGAAAALLSATAALYAATALQPGAEINASRTATPTEKARLVRLSYVDGGTFRKPWVVVYADGPDGRQDVYMRSSFDDGANWSTPVLLSRDAAGMPTAGQSVTTRDGRSFAADNDKPSVFAPPVTSGPRMVVTWNSAYCPPDPAARHAGAYASAAQGTGDFDGDGTLDRPFRCVWVATTTDPALSTWDVQQVTDATRDAIGEVVSGSATGNAFALAWQEDPAGLQPGEAEGRGDGGMGAMVSGGTNVWYAHAPTPSGATLRANVVQLTDNELAGTGQPGASRPNLQVSGTTAVVAYEETGCPGSTAGKCVVYHAFPYAAPQSHSAGTIVSDVTRNSRRVRFVLQGAAAAGTSPLRAVLLWRESVSLAPGAPADIVVRRGLVDTASRPGSTGLLPQDILADTPQRLTDLAATGGNANAHRAVVRGSFVGIAYDATPDMAGADPEKTAVPTAHYNLFFTRSVADGQPGGWTPAVNLSGLTDPAWTVVEPRLVPTPATVVNPLTGLPDEGDVQDPNVLYVSFATESSTLVGLSGRVHLSRSTDQGASFEPFVPVSATPAGQSEAQLRPSPDGSSVMVLWMGEQAPGEAATKDAMLALLRAVPLPDLRLTALAEAFPSGSSRTVSVSVTNVGAGEARNVVLAGTLPVGLEPVGISPSACVVSSRSFRCAVPSIPASGAHTVFLAVTAASAGSYVVDASVSNDVLDADASDNTLAFAASATQAITPPAPDLPEAPDAVPQGGGGGCTTARGDAPLDPTLALLVALGMLGLRARRPSGSGMVDRTQCEGGPAMLP